MLRVITLNLNGIRSAARKDLFVWLRRQKTDIVCVQELKAQRSDMTDVMLTCGLLRGYFHYAEKKGYSGVALYAKREPDRVIEGLGIHEFDAEGRYLRADFGKLSVISVYLPSGSSGAHRQAMKFKFMDVFYPHLKALRKEKREFILCGDWNIAHKPIDLKNWKSNQKNSGFLPEERAWLDTLFDSGKFIDAFRDCNTEPDQYTWWSNRGQAYAKNVGWRIDYHIAGSALRGKVLDTHIYKKRRFSDHAPLIIDYDFEF